ncbi:ectoine/hydroxyectoine ABC transporter permease subunit EhuD [Mangrovactinospora gilvigrisea]|uniref:Ectoine/hydroxyectoine ABC transporter permease subunit EhuD n=1 Tax=Mangrovactinospora gilvigrisea TaxID=1428644 RepID=A0A1J7BI36_9ACTN|nr:ectoine/hydroxyectoine ABC transporter permease subunit EhuD [Mangrovactinospora gilvigrisea]OIV38310.1 ectoine/hydroxyectoine ABC transporter permease subunit EhuD [Mangrovactinospora gilvigrisea]
MGDAFPSVIAAFFKVTLVSTVVGTAVAAALGLVWAILGRSRTRWVTVPVKVVVEFIRSTPLMIQLFALWVLLGSLPTEVIGIAMLGIHFSTYMSEVYRAGIDAVPRGQWEAATALSLPRSHTWRAVILPQAVRNVLPGLGNYAIAMFKYTPFLSVIGVGEMVRTAQDYGSNHFEYPPVFTLCGLIFLAASYPTSLAMRKLEKRLGH